MGGDFIPALAPQLAPTSRSWAPHPHLTGLPALLPGDRYLEDTHSQRCVLLQLAVLAGGLGGLPGQAVFVPPAAQVLMDRHTDWERDEEAQGPPTTPPSMTSSSFSTYDSHNKPTFTGHPLEWPWGKEIRIGLRPPAAPCPARLAPLPPPGLGLPTTFSPQPTSFLLPWYWSHSLTPTLVPASLLPPA